MARSDTINFGSKNDFLLASIILGLQPLPVDFVYQLPGLPMMHHKFWVVGFDQLMWMHGDQNLRKRFLFFWLFSFNWAVLSEEQMSIGYPFSLLNDEQMSNKVGVEHQPVTKRCTIDVPSTSSATKTHYGLCSWFGIITLNHTIVNPRVSTDCGLSFMFTVHGT